MPRGRLRPCRQIGCPNLVCKGYCPDHQRQGNKVGKALYDEKRGTASSRGYGARWQRYRKSYLSRHPLCVMHQERGEVVAATVVDHIIPVNGPNDPLFWDEDNHQSLCRDCHTYKTREIDHRGYGSKK